MNNLDSGNIHILLHEMVRVIMFALMRHTANIWTRDIPLLWMIVSLLVQVPSSLLTIHSLW
jgi:hypothetical protein